MLMFTTKAGKAWTDVNEKFDNIFVSCNIDFLLENYRFAILLICYSFRLHAVVIKC